ncbi:MAG: class I SAM-dependent methyltransferase [Bryobacterales bacterium]|nr:class I SAM-dependent methyltransferase [Bryobacterales bacterium]
MSFQHIQLTDPLLSYVREVSDPEPAYLAELREETAPLPRARMQITVEQGALMAMLTRLLGVRRAIEVGVFTGYSSLSVARALPPDGELIACDISEEFTAIARKYWAKAGLADRIHLHLRPATETLEELIAQGQGGQFDLAFIDADKENYDTYYERCLQLVKPGGLILIDNVLWHGDVIDPNKQDIDTLAIRAINEKIRNDARVTCCLLPLGDGLTLARKN